MTICLVQKDFVLSIGGDTFGTSNSVEFHNLRNDSWKSLSDLNEARKNASSCVLAQNIYVFCGQGNSNNKCLSSIESISVEAL